MRVILDLFQKNKIDKRNTHGQVVNFMLIV